MHIKQCENIFESFIFHPIQELNTKSSEVIIKIVLFGSIF